LKPVPLGRQDISGAPVHACAFLTVHYHAPQSAPRSRVRRSGRTSLAAGSVTRMRVTPVRSCSVMSAVIRDVLFPVCLDESRLVGVRVRGRTLLVGTHLARISLRLVDHVLHGRD
jgi:hypothetical protein